MKKIIILLTFLSLNAFSQQEGHFKAERKQVMWQLTFATPDKDILDLLAQNSKKLTMNKEDSSGRGSNLLCNCKGGGWYFEQTFDFNFFVKITDGKYQITVTDITFDGEGENETNNKLENYVLRLGQNVFHTTPQNKVNLQCLDVYFTKLFKIPTATIAE